MLYQFKISANLSSNSNNYYLIFYNEIIMRDQKYIIRKIDIKNAEVCLSLKVEVIQQWIKDLVYEK